MVIFTSLFRDSVLVMQIETVDDSELLKSKEASNRGQFESTTFRAGFKVVGAPEQSKCGDPCQ
jgi:hypothetical protein